MALNRATVAQPITINDDTSYAVLVQFWDSTDPANASVQAGQVPVSVLWAEMMSISAGASVAQLQADVLARGQRLKQGLANQAAARAAVPVGTTITIT